MVTVELKVSPPKDHSPVAPVLVRLVTPEKTEPFNKMRGETAVKSPPKEDEGPVWSSVYVPVRIRLFALLPSCVNCLSDSVPVVKLPELTCKPYPAARVAVDAVF